MTSYSDNLQKKEYSAENVLAIYSLSSMRYSTVINKLIFMNNNFVFVLEASAQLMILFIGIIFGLHNVFSYM